MESKLANTVNKAILQIKRIHQKAIIPKKGSLGAAGYDLYSIENCIIPARGKNLVNTGISVALPEETYGRIGKGHIFRHYDHGIAPRSGLALKHSIDVGAGVIDVDYRGEGTFVY